MQSDYEFSSTDNGKTWTRKLFGIEQLIAVMSSKTPGFGTLTGGYVVAFPNAVDTALLRKFVEAAWIRLRQTAPIVAYKTKDAKNPEFSLYLEYIVPEDALTAQKWAGETIKWHEDKVSLRERDIAMKDLWWRAADARYNYELHIAPDIENGKWQILIHSVHWSSDVRGTLQLSELLFTYLNEYITSNSSEAPILNSLEWGRETAKLTPPSAIAAALASGIPMSTLFPKARASETKPEEPPVKSAEVDSQDGEAAPSESAGPALFLRSAALVDTEPKYDARACDVSLTADETVKFRDACRAHGVTVTQAITALTAVAEVEWSLSFTQGESAEEREETLETYKTASHIPIVWNVVDQRNKLKEYTRHDSAKGSCPISAEGFPLMLDMVAIRQAVKYNKDTNSVERDSSDAVFWDVVVKMAQDMWKTSDTDLPAYTEREMFCQAYSSMYDPTAYMIPALMSSSVGDIEKLGLLTAFSPAVPSNEMARLVVEEVSLGVRCPTPSKMVLAWQWNNQITIRPQTAARWTSEAGMQAMCKVFRSWIDATCM
ncbi:hypothetical protein DFH11DRAFT_1689464 [Phellopilus nigrolimitatus]|nr:hypothetical protein DFH11DRAFT_1689464 [Phellopilus nigrolimitatus]